MRGIVVMIFFVGLLCSCGQNREFDKNQKFNENNNDAIIVLGMSMVGSPIIRSGFFNQNEFPDKATLVWLRFEGNGSDTFIADFPGKIWNEKLKLKNPEEHFEYMYFSVKPGMYFLRAASYTNDGRKRGLISAVSAPSIEAKAGKITYIGDFSLEFLLDTVSIKKYSRHDDAAVQSMAQYPNLKGAMIYQEPGTVQLGENNLPK